LNNSKTARLIFITLFLAALAGPAIAADRQKAFVTEVISGDTVKLRGGKTLKYANIQAPPLQSKLPAVRAYGEASLAFNKSLVDQKEIEIEWGNRLRDEQNNLLGFVFLGDGRFVNLEMLKAGHARAVVKAPNLKYAADFRKKDMGARLVKIHHELAAPKIQPATVQEEFVIETDAGYDLGGTFDHTEKDDTIADTKTSKTSYTEENLHGFQPVLYDFAFQALRGRPAAGFRFDVLVKGGKKVGPKYEPIQGKPSQEDREHLFYTIGQVHQAIQSGVALPAPEGAWWCSRKWCGYAFVCPRFKGRK
jgi:micrococcal nuclease